MKGRFIVEVQQQLVLQTGALVRNIYINVTTSVVLCQLVSSRGQLWICNTCHRKISTGQMPAEC